jgi:hypothetical protein
MYQYQFFVDGYVYVVYADTEAEALMSLKAEFAAKGLALEEVNGAT